MIQDQIEELISRLRQTEYEYAYSGRSTICPVLSKSNPNEEAAVRSVLAAWIQDCILLSKTENEVLKAKVRFYEEMIGKSNFAPFLEKPNAPADLPAVAGKVRRDVRLPVDRPWADYPVGTRAYAYNGGWWERVERGWKPNSSKDVFPTPGGDAVGQCIELPNAESEGLT